MVIQLDTIAVCFIDVCVPKFVAKQFLSLFVFLIVVCNLYYSFPLTERAKAFWDKEDVDEIFDTVLEYLDQLKEAFRKKTATDKGWTSIIAATTCDLFPCCDAPNFLLCVLQNICRG